MPSTHFALQHFTAGGRGCNSALPPLLPPPVTDYTSQNEQWDTETQAKTKTQSQGKLR